jgi:DNA-binding GntR family transcriptional regulator
MIQRPSQTNQTDTISAFSPITHTELSNKIYELVREKIFSRALKPGERLNINTLASQLRVSRTPVYQALLRLSRENLVTIEPRRITFVTALTVEDVANTYDLRLALELLAAEKGIHKIQASQIAFGRIILIEVYKGLNIDVINVRVFYAVPARDPRVVHPEHEAILAAYEARDLDNVKELLTMHLSANKGAVIQALTARNGVI